MGAHDIATEALTDRQYADQMGRVNNKLRARVGWLESVNEDQYDEIETLAREVACRFEVPQSHAKGMAALKARVGEMAFTIHVHEKSLDEMAATIRTRDKRIVELTETVARLKVLDEQRRDSKRWLRDLRGQR